MQVYQNTHKDVSGFDGDKWVFSVEKETQEQNDNEDLLALDE